MLFHDADPHDTHSHSPVHVYSTQTANLIRMCESLALNQWADNGRVELYRRGVSNVDNQHMQVIVPNNPVQGRIRPVPSGQAISSETTTRSSFVTTMTLDYLAQSQGWLDNDNPKFSIRLLKMDVEGAEPSVIQGAQQLLTKGIVRNVLTEFRRPSHPETQRSIGILMDAGYRIVNDEAAGIGEIRLDRNGTLAYLMELDRRFERREFKWGYADLWFQLDDGSHR